ncbi:glycosyltransferase family 4 protein [Halomicrobium katesii]|uniref:glycosyltransferase family 4 protein n=1 Tax=Halomicrobium katesii TaxID=437163 RepID=UPI0014616D65|nr:glycosyltransferase family 4 protein [Halomicrobium katesii]
MFTDLPSRGFSPELEHTEVDGMEVKAIPRVLPHLEFTQYVTNRQQWRAALADADVCFAIGGPNQCGFPYVLQNKPFAGWFATLLWDDRAGRIQSASLPRKLRDYVSRPALESIERRVFEAANFVYVLSDYTMDRITTEYEIAESKITAVPHPIDVETFSPDGPTVPKDDDELRITFVGRFNDDRKNMPMLMSAFSQVVEAVPNATLQLIGAEPDSHVTRAVRDNGLEDVVEFVDYVAHDELPAYYRTADIFVIPSLQEGLSIAGMEAMSCGLPVVSTRCGGPATYVEDGENGHLVPNDDPDALSDALVHVLTDHDHREQLSAAARETIVSRYSEAQLRSIFLDGFERLAAEVDG